MAAFVAAIGKSDTCISQRYITVTPPCRPGGVWKIHEDETMTPMTYGRGVWDMAKYVRFLEARVHVSVGHVSEPSALNDPVLLGVLLMLLVPAAYTGWRIYTSSWIGNPWIWSTVLLAVFMFATSGAGRSCLLLAPLFRESITACFF